MRSSRRSIEWRSHSAGFTLLEVAVAASIFAVVMVIAFTQINESTDATKGATVQADLRRSGEDILARIVRDLRSTQSRFVGGTANEIQFHRVIGFDPSIPEVTLDNGTTAGANAPPTAATTLHFYRARVEPSPGLTARLEYGFVPRGTYGSARPIVLSRELNPTTGLVFSLSNGSFPGLISTNAGFVLNDVPNELGIQLVLRRRIGRPGTPGEFAEARLITRVQLKPSSAY